MTERGMSKQGVNTPPNLWFVLCRGKRRQALGAGRGNYVAEALRY